MDTKYVTAIDIGTTKIVALVGRRNENKKLEVMDYASCSSKGIRRGEILNPEEAAGVVRSVIQEVQLRTGVIFSKVFVGIAGQHISMEKSRTYTNRESYDDAITDEDVMRLMRDANNIALDDNKEIIEIIPQSFIVDSETDINNPVGMLGKRLEAIFNVVVASSDSVKRIKRCINLSQIEINGDVILEPLASAEAVLYEEEREAGVALVDIGGGTTDLAIFHNKKIRHTKVIPFGGCVVTKDIKEACGLMTDVAENIKLQHGVAMSEKTDKKKTLVIPHKIPGRDPKELAIHRLASIIEARMSEIVEAVVFEIEESGYFDKLGYGIVITGGGAMLDNIKDLFQYYSGMEVRIGYPGRHLSTGEAVGGINEPCYATGVGLLLSGLKYIEKNSIEISTTSVKVPDNEVTITEEVTTIEDVKIEDKKPVTKRIRLGKPLISMKKIREAISEYFDVEPETKMV
jgi:cell division protein FtsA